MAAGLEMREEKRKLGVRLTCSARGALKGRPYKGGGRRREGGEKAKKKPHPRKAEGAAPRWRLGGGGDGV